MMDSQTAQTVVKVISVLYWIGAVLGVIGGLGMLFGGGALGMMGGFAFGGILGGFLAVMGVIMIIIAILEAFVGYGLWKFKMWAKTVAIVLGVIGVIMGLFSLPFGILTLVISGGIVYFLAFNNDVKALFK